MKCFVLINTYRLTQKWCQSIGIDNTNTFQLKFFSSMKIVGVNVLDGLWALEWAWHPAETNLRCAGGPGICMSLALIVSEISAFIRTDGHGWIDSASDPDQEYIYFMGLEKLPFACDILSDESSIPFYPTNNGYKKLHFVRP